MYLQKVEIRMNTPPYMDLSNSTITLTVFE